MSIYQSVYVQDIRASYASHLSNRVNQPLQAYLKRLADHLWHTTQQGITTHVPEINNYHPKYIGKDWMQIQELGFAREDAFDVLAWEHGFSGWSTIDDRYCDSTFEDAVDALITGDQVLLKADDQATMPIYGGHFDTLSLLESSAHPRAAGVLSEVSALLMK